MIRPSWAARMWGSARRASRMGATTIVSRAARASSSSTSSMAPVAEKPALLTMMVGRYFRMTRAQACASVTSRMAVSTVSPTDPAASVTAAAFARVRTVPTERTPRRASSSAVASPMPEFAPVVTATRAVVIESPDRSTVASTVAGIQCCPSGIGRPSVVGRLDDVHGLIREADGLADRFSCRGDVQTNAPAHHDLPAVYSEWLGQDGFQAQCEFRQPCEGDPLGADGELVASEPSEAVLWTQAGAHPVRRIEEDLVSGVVAERVVDRFEAVEVDVQYADVGHRPPARLRPQGPLEHLGEEFTIAEPGEGIVGGAMGEILLGSDPAADVDVGDHRPTRRSPGGGATGVEPSADGRGRARVLTIALDSLAGQHGLQAREHFFGIRTAGFRCAHTDVPVVDAHSGGLGATAIVQREHPPGSVDGNDGSSGVENRRGVGQGSEDVRGEAGIYEHARSRWHTMIIGAVAQKVNQFRQDCWCGSPLHRLPPDSCLHSSPRTSLRLLGSRGLPS